jgi:hypothetical protein
VRQHAVEVVGHDGDRLPVVEPAVALAIGKQLASPRVAGKRGPARRPPMAAGEERPAYGRVLALEWRRKALEWRRNFLRRLHNKLSYPLLSLSLSSV